MLPDIPVLYFHSIAPEKNKQWVKQYLTLELPFFEDFLKYLNKNRWSTIFLDEYYHLRKTNKTPNSKLCCLTFDDGYVDNYLYVFPLLGKYGFKGTIFVNPEFVDEERTSLRNRDDMSGSIKAIQKNEHWGFLSWEEMREMQSSGIIDIQSHTLTHTKYFVSDELVSLHYPGGDCLYPIGNLFPEKKPYYINNPDFETLIPYGTPFFHDMSSVIAHKVSINPDFNEIIIDLLNGFEWQLKNSVSIAKEMIRTEYLNWKKADKIIISRESEEEYHQRVKDEILKSKVIIENKLNKKVEFLCWPHGDNNETIHQLALETGYNASTTGSKQKIKPSYSRIALRTSIGVVWNNIFLTRIKTRYRISVASGNSISIKINTIRGKFKT